MGRRTSAVLPSTLASLPTVPTRTESCSRIHASASGSQKWADGAGGAPARRRKSPPDHRCAIDEVDDGRGERARRRSPRRNAQGCAEGPAQVQSADGACHERGRSRERHLNAPVRCAHCVRCGIERPAPPNARVGDEPYREADPHPNEFRVTGRRYTHGRTGPPVGEGAPHQHSGGRDQGPASTNFTGRRRGLQRQPVPGRAECALPTRA